MRHSVALIFAVTAVGAAAQAQAPDEAQQCYAAMWASPTIAPVLARVETKTPEEAIKLRTSTAKATAKEKPAIAFWLAEIEKCQAIGNRQMAAWPIEGQTLIRNWQVETNKAIADLYAGSITWGGYIQGGIERDEAHRARIYAYDQQLRAAIAQYDAEQKRQAEAQKALQEAQAQARYEAAAAARARDEQIQRVREQEARNRSQQQFNEGLQMLIQANQPRPTVRCTSNRFFDMTTTTCN